MARQCVQAGVAGSALLHHHLHCPVGGVQGGACRGPEECWRS
ncbi:hypothetical protein E2C01_099392 [Portunus trituberculatus]|uniref:Uncharacterized protein n=1 Tax=Portunus trituberculatus TaxID=210409 RepID=A0A5B7K089_PORTR|nr:hypothetical protein [Portunus trituberculatus]